MTLEIAQITQGQITGKLEKNELEKKHKKWSWLISRYFPGILMEELRKPTTTSVRTVKE